MQNQMTALDYFNRAIHHSDHLDYDAALRDFARAEMKDNTIFFKTPLAHTVAFTFLRRGLRDARKNENLNRAILDFWMALIIDPSVLIIKRDLPPLLMYVKEKFDCNYFNDMRFDQEVMEYLSANEENKDVRDFIEKKLIAYFSSLYNGRRFINDLYHAFLINRLRVKASKTKMGNEAWKVSSSQLLEMEVDALENAYKAYRDSIGFEMCLLTSERFFKDFYPTIIELLNNHSPDQNVYPYLIKRADESTGDKYYYVKRDDQSLLGFIFIEISADKIPDEWKLIKDNEIRTVRALPDMPVYSALLAAGHPHQDTTQEKRAKFDGLVDAAIKNGYLPLLWDSLGVEFQKEYDLRSTSGQDVSQKYMSGEVRYEYIKELKKIIYDKLVGSVQSDRDGIKKILAYADLTHFSFSNIDFRDASIYGAKFSGSKITSCDFTGTNFLDADFGDAEVTDCKFIDYKNDPDFSSKLECFERMDEMRKDQPLKAIRTNLYEEISKFYNELTQKLISLINAKIEDHADILSYKLRNIKCIQQNQSLTPKQVFDEILKLANNALVEIRKELKSPNALKNLESELVKLKEIKKPYDRLPNYLANYTNTILNSRFDELLKKMGAYYQSKDYDSVLNASIEVIKLHYKCIEGDTTPFVNNLINLLCDEDCIKHIAEKDNGREYVVSLIDALPEKSMRLHLFSLCLDKNTNLGRYMWGVRGGSSFRIFSDILDNVYRKLTQLEPSFIGSKKIDSFAVDNVFYQPAIDATKTNPTLTSP